VILGLGCVVALGLIGRLFLRAHFRFFEARHRVLAETVKALSAGKVRHGNDPNVFTVRTPDGVRVHGTFLVDKDENPATSLLVTAEQNIPTDLVMAQESFASRLGKLVTGADVETGDEAFDREVLLRGSEARLLAVLDADTRAIVRAAVAAGTTVANGAARAMLGSGADKSKVVIAHALATAAVARAISDRVGMPATFLRENVEHDALPGVRRRSLEVLLAQFPEHAETATALDAASNDADADLRLFASARLRGGSASDALSRVAGDLSMSDDARAVAFREFLATNAGARGIVLAEKLLGDRSPAVRALAIRTMGKARRSLSMAKLLSLAANATEPIEGLALAETFWRLRDPAAEGVLLKMLESGDVPVRTESARALGRVGGVGSVEPLRRVQGLFSGGLGRVAEEAIASIQGRLRNAAEGQLTVADSPAGEGRVSLPADRGAVSIPPKTPREG